MLEVILMVGCLKLGDLEIGMLDLPEGLGHRIRLLTTSRILLYFFLIHLSRKHIRVTKSKSTNSSMPKYKLAYFYNLN